MEKDLKRKFQELSTALQSLHRDLLMKEAKHLEGESGRKLTPYELLHASLNDPNLAWLRQLSTLIVNIDTTVDEAQNLSSSEAAQISDSVLTLLEKPAGLIETDFWRHYSDYLSHDVDIIMKHSQVKALVAELRPKM